MASLHGGEPSRRMTVDRRGFDLPHRQSPWKKDGGWPSISSIARLAERRLPPFASHCAKQRAASVQEPTEDAPVRRCSSRVMDHATTERMPVDRPAHGLLPVMQPWGATGNPSAPSGPVDELLQRLRVEALVSSGTVGENRFVKQVGNPGKQVQQLRVAQLVLFTGDVHLVVFQLGEAGDHAAHPARRRSGPPFQIVPAGRISQQVLFHEGDTVFRKPRFRFVASPSAVLVVQDVLSHRFRSFLAPR